MHWSNGKKEKKTYFIFLTAVSFTRILQPWTYSVYYHDKGHWYSAVMSCDKKNRLVLQSTKDTLRMNHHLICLCLIPKASLPIMQNYRPQRLLCQHVWQFSFLTAVTLNNGCTGQRLRCHFLYGKHTQQNVWGCLSASLGWCSPPWALREPLLDKTHYPSLLLFRKLIIPSITIGLSDNRMNMPSHHLIRSLCLEFVGERNSSQHGYISCNYLSKVTSLVWHSIALLVIIDFMFVALAFLHVLFDSRALCLTVNWWVLWLLLAVVCILFYIPVTHFKKLVEMREKKNTKRCLLLLFYCNTLKIVPHFKLSLRLKMPDCCCI